MAGRAEGETLLRRAAAFIQRCRDGLRHDVEESSDVYDMCLAVEKTLPEAPRLRLFLLTNSITTITTLPDSSLDGLPVSYEIWDLARFHRMASSGTLSEPIIVEFDEPLPCLATPETDRDFSVFLTILPGSTLSALYGQYGTRLLELNVRSFLQAKGAVNRGIRDTLLTDPERFLAYNNGITATASKVEFSAPGRRPGCPPDPRPADRQRRADHRVDPLRPRPGQGRRHRGIRPDETHRRRGRAAAGDRPGDLQVLQHPEQGHP